MTGSLAVHGAIALAITAYATRAAHQPPPDTPREIAIEIVEREAPAIAIASSGSAPAPASASSATVSTPVPPAIAMAPPVATRHAATPTHARSVSHAVDMIVSVEPVGGSGIDGFGDGHRGSGIGFGDGRGLVTPEVTAPAPPPPPEPLRPLPSSSRPPRLIWPAREGEIDERELFIARLTIDRDGIVVGAHLLQGSGGWRDFQAENAVWRFRYRPALDDAGRPVQVTIEQPFLLH